jgi:hypothetical protein
MEVAKDFGHCLDETTFKNALQACNPDLHFDVASRQGWSHLRQSQWQGVWLGEKHITAMGRGQLPEFDIWASRGPNRLFILQIGWRDTVQRMIAKNVPGVSWEKLCSLLSVPRLYFTGAKESLDIGAKTGFDFIN